MGLSKPSLSTQICNRINNIYNTSQDISDELDDILSEINNVLLETENIEHHLHNNEKWFGVAGTPNGEIHRADRLGPGVQPFQLVAGNNTWGQWVQIIGSGDTPVQAGRLYYDVHRILVTSTTSTRVFVVQIINGESSEIAGKLAVEDFDEFPYIAASNNNDSGISEIINLRAPTGRKAWMRTCDIGGNGTNINFYVGLHEYDE